MYQGEGEEKEATQLILAQVLNRIVRLLHPFVPFITEEIYQKLPIKDKAAVIDSYPNPELDKEWLEMGSERAAQEMDLVREVILAIRNIRGENRIPPSVKFNIRLAPNTGDAQKSLGNNKGLIQSLAKVEEIEIGEVGSLSKCAVALVQTDKVKVSVIVPLEGLVDIQKEIGRLEKTIEKTKKEYQGLSRRLENENFLKNAPEEIVVQDKEKLQILSTRIQGLQENLDRLR
jgi:valyl-tRNA synthetase